MRDSGLTIRVGSYDDRLKAGNLSPDEVRKLAVELSELKTANEALRTDLDKALYKLRLIANSGSQWKDQARKLLNEIEYGTDDPIVIAAVERALAFRSRK